AWIRFANASSASDRDKDVRGMSIRLSGVTGENLTPGETRQDFVLNSHPVMVAANTKDFMELMKAMEAGGLDEAAYFLKHPRAAASRPAAEPRESGQPAPVRGGRVQSLVRPCRTPPARQHEPGAPRDLSLDGGVPAAAPRDAVAVGTPPDRQHETADHAAID